MKPEELEEVGKIIAEEFTALRADLETRIDRAVLARALPPFVPPPIWTVGRHGAGHLVRHRNGLFMARRDTDAEPPDESWLPVLVGVASLDLRWIGEREMSLQAVLSDGASYEMVKSIAVPIVRGYWDAETKYVEGDRVFRYGEYHAVAENQGIEPGSVNGERVWLKVGGKHAAAGHTDDFKLSVERIIATEVVPLFEKVGDRLAALERERADAASR